MDVFTLVRMLGALLLVLGLMAVALYVVRRYDIRLPGRVGGGAQRRLELVEKTALDTRRSVALLRRDGREHLILIAPEGNMVIESGIIRDAIDREAEAERVAAAEEARAAAEAAMAETRAELAAMRATFAQNLEAATARMKTRAEAATGAARSFAVLVMNGPAEATADAPAAAEPTAKAA